MGGENLDLTDGNEEYTPERKEDIATLQKAAEVLAGLSDAYLGQHAPFATFFVVVGTSKHGMLDTVSSTTMKLDELHKMIHALSERWDAEDKKKSNGDGALIIAP